MARKKFEQLDLKDAFLFSAALEDPEACRLILEFTDRVSVSYFPGGNHMARKKFEQLDLKDAFLFSAALEDPEACRLILELFLGYPIAKITVHAEHSILLSSDFKSIRLDIYASDELSVGYNMEMQNEKENNLPMRSRYYQSELDIAALKPGEDYNDMKPGYIIFICTFDPFGKGLYKYTFENRCLETDMPLGDKTMKIFFNTKGTNPEDVSEELLAFLAYVEDSTDSCAEKTQSETVHKIHNRIKELKKNREMGAKFMLLEEAFLAYVEDSTDSCAEKTQSETVHKIHNRIKELKKNREMGAKFMLLEELIKDAQKKAGEEGISKGRSEEQNRYSGLILQLAKDGRSDLIVKAASDTHLLNALYEEYKL